MHKAITFRGMESSPVLEQRIHEQLQRIEKFLENEPSPVHINMVVESHPVHAHHKFEIRLSAPNYHIIMSEEGPDIYKIINEVLEGAYDELQEEKKKLVDRRHKGCNGKCT